MSMDKCTCPRSLVRGYCTDGFKTVRDLLHRALSFSCERSEETASSEPEYSICYIQKSVCECIVAQEPSDFCVVRHEDFQFDSRLSKLFRCLPCQLLVSPYSFAKAMVLSL